MLRSASTAARTAVVLAAAAVALSGCGSQLATGTAQAAPTAGATTGAALAVLPESAIGARILPDVPRVSAGRFALGDSVMLGSKPRLVRAGFRVDATVSRQFGSGVSLVRTAAARGALPRNVVVHLGTNGTIAARDCRAIVAAAGPERRVFLVNVRVPRSWTPGNNRTLRACAAAFPPGRVELIDWVAASAGHPNWLGRDRIHPSAPGRAAYVALIDATVDRRGL